MNDFAITLTEIESQIIIVERIIAKRGSVYGSRRNQNKRI